MKRFAIIALAIATLVPTAFAQKVRVDFNKDHDFSSYRTYAWKGCTAPQNDPVLRSGFTTGRIRTAVSAELALKEMREVDANENPDVFFTCWIGSENKTEVWGSHSGPGWGGGYWGRRGAWGWGGYGHSTVNTTRYTEAVYVVDMVDANTDQLVWRSHATVRITNTDKDAKRIERMARRAFKKFPAGPVETASLKPAPAARGESILPS